MSILIWNSLSRHPNPIPSPFYVPFRAGITGIAYSSLRYLPWKICKLSVRYSILYGSVLGALEFLTKKLLEVVVQNRRPRQQPLSAKRKFFILTLSSFANFVLSYGISKSIRGHHHLLVQGIQLKDHFALFSVASLVSEAAIFLSLR